MVPFKPTLVNNLPQITCMLFVLPDDAQVEVLSAPAGVDSKGKWGKIRHQIGRVCHSNDRLPDVNVVSVTQRWAMHFPLM